MHEDIAQAILPEVGTLLLLLPQKNSLDVIAWQSNPLLTVSKELQVSYQCRFIFSWKSSMQQFNQNSLINSSLKQGHRQKEKHEISSDLVSIFMHGTRNTFPLTMSKLKNVTGMYIFNIPDNAHMPHVLHSKMPPSHQLWDTSLIK